MSLINVKAEMTGTVWKVEVKEGEKVSEGDVLIVLESMKMEIPIIAPVNGYVEKIMVSEGETINEDSTAVMIKVEE